MPTKAEIVNQIEEQIIPNLMELITGGILQNVLLGMVDQINTLVGELDDLNTDDRSSIVNSINELVSNIQAIEDNLTPYVYFGLDDPNIVTPVGFEGDIPSFYVQQEHVEFDVVNVGFWTYTGIFGKEWVNLSLDGGGIQSVQAGTNINVDNTDPQNPIISATGGTTPTLLEVLTQDNDAEDKTIKFSYDDGGISQQTAEIGFLEFEGGLGGTYKRLAFGTPDSYVSPLGFFNNVVDQEFSVILASEEEGGIIYNNFHIISNTQSRGITANQYFGANYDDNTYVQKKYVDDQIETREQTIRLVLTPDDEDAETGDKVGFYVDGDWDIISAHATAQTAPTGSAITINIKKNGSSITSTPITIPNGGHTSFASGGAVFSSTSVTTGDLLVPSIASVGSTIKGQNLQLIFKYIRK